MFLNSPEVFSHNFFSRSSILIFATVVGKVCWKNSWLVHLTLYTAADLLAFHNKFQNQVLLVRTILWVNPCDMLLVEMFFK